VAFDTNPTPGQTIIPRNYGNGQTFFLTTLRAGGAASFNARRIEGRLRLSF
jgi:hypothetical protein